MARSDITLHRAETVFEELEQLRSAISQRAYDLFQRRGDVFGAPMSDWLRAEEQLVWKPAIELRRKDNEFEVLVATPGVDAKDLDVQITPDDVLIKADVHHTHTPDEGDIQLCEFNTGQLFRSIHFPERVDPDHATAEYRDGMLRLHAPIVKATAQKVEVRTT